MSRYLSRAQLRLGHSLFEDFCGDAGGIVTFVGTPRRFSHGREILALEYEAYEAMAESRLDDLILEAQLRWSLREVSLQHRLGRVMVGQPSIVVQVRAEHRYEAFCASQFLIDQLKREVPIWKKEIYADGTESWVHCQEEGMSVKKGAAR